MKTFYFLMFLFFVFLAPAGAQLTQQAALEKFVAANNLYRDNKFDDAVKSYEEIVASGVGSGALYYNLGNAYLKAGRLGLAIFYYEKAKEIIPQDKDLKFNYEYAVSQIKAPTVTPSENQLGNLFFQLGLFLGLTSHGPQAVVIQNTAARFEPKENATVHYQLFEGQKVKVLQEDDGWVKIQRSDQKSGWVVSDAVKKI